MPWILVQPGPVVAFSCQRSSDPLKRNTATVFIPAGDLQGQSNMHCNLNSHALWPSFCGCSYWSDCVASSFREANSPSRVPCVPRPMFPPCICICICASVSICVSICACEYVRGNWCDKSPLRPSLPKERAVCTRCDVRGFQRLHQLGPFRNLLSKAAEERPLPGWPGRRPIGPSGNINVFSLPLVPTRVPLTALPCLQFSVVRGNAPHHAYQTTPSVRSTRALHD